MEDPIVSPGTTPDQEDPIFSCKGCGEILEEGKAFELAGNRWHIDCFRCNSCRTLLDSDANLLLLGDGSLICNNCTYSCKVCHNKIEDLAILTGEDAFCAKCFKCRNCKRKIENLKYAKTSQGIFCMQCHESLMARRKKKKAAQRSNSSQSIPQSTIITFDKSLPALPSHKTPTTPTPSSNRFDGQDDANTRTVKNGLAAAYKPDRSSETIQEQKENMILASRTYGDDQFSVENDEITSDDGFVIPVALDTNPATVQTSSRRTNGGELTKDYFGNTGPASASNFRSDFADLLSTTSRSESQERVRSASRGSPHIAYQEKGRGNSADTVEAILKRKESGISTPASSMASPQIGTADRYRLSALSATRDLDDPVQPDKFKLQDAPKRRSSGSASHKLSPRSDSPVGHVTNHTKASPNFDNGSESTSNTDRPRSPDLTSLPKRMTSFKNSPLATPSSRPFERPARGDSMNKQQNLTGSSGLPSRKELPRDAEVPSSILQTQSSVGRQESVRGKSISKPSLANLATGGYDSLPVRSPRRPSSGQNAASSDTGDVHESDFISPRQAPPAPPSRHRLAESVSSIQGDEDLASPMPLMSSTGDAFPEDDRYSPDDEGGLFRKMSKVVRHGRSQSDKIGSASPKWAPKGSRNVSVDISSPIAATSGEGEDVDLRNKLRYSQQRIAQLEAEKLALEEKVNSSEDIRHVNSELRQKRSTMAVLDTQRELVVRELEAMTGQLQQAKSSSGPINIEQLRSDVMRDFASSLERLKDDLRHQIEELMGKKNELTAEISNLIQMKDKGFQEYESLTSKNQQLNEHNNQLVHNIQDLYRQGKQSSTTGYSGQSSNGLGIFSHRSDLSVDGRTEAGGYSQYSGDTEVEPATVLTAPHVVNIRKGQPKKFINWKKGRDTVGKNITKGLKGAFGSAQNSNLREEQFAEGVPYNNIPAADAPITGTVPMAPSRMGVDGTRQPWNFLSAEKTKGYGTTQPPKSSAGLPLTTVRSNNSTSTSATLPVGTPNGENSLFGSDLTSRCEYERSVIPAIVISCIDQVSLRGMDQVGVYRKSGSSTQVKTIQAGFEKDHGGYDISDPDLDIHAVTGCLKQYLRRLPNPLITFESYDTVLDSVKGGEDTPDHAKVARIKDAVRFLPKCHRETLEFLCFHLVAVMERSSENLMTPVNLAVVFAPTIMRPFAIEREITDAKMQREVVQLMLDNFTVVFEPDHDT